MDDFPIIVISLRDSIARRDAISKMLHNLELPFIFHDAVDGRQGLPPECEEEVDRALTQRTLGRGMSDAEYACALSHFAVYEHILKNKLTGAIVLEDDAIVKERFREFIAYKYYLNYNMVFLAHGSAYAYPKTKERLHRAGAIWKLKTNPDRSTGYSILSCVAQKFIETMKPIHRPADSWPYDLSDLCAGIAHPSIVGFDDEAESEIISQEQKALRLHEVKKKNKMRHFKSHYWKNKFRKIKMQLLYKYIPCSTKEVS